MWVVWDAVIPWPAGSDADPELSPARYLSCFAKIGLCRDLTGCGVMGLTMRAVDDMFNFSMLGMFSPSYRRTVGISGVGDFIL